MKKQKFKAPSAPTLSPFTKQLGEYGNRLSNFDFSGNLAPLAQTVELDPEVTRLALQFAQQSLAPAWDANIKNLRNEAANAGALQSSTFTDALTGAGRDLQSEYQAITTQAALGDRERALQNRIKLFGAGLESVGTAGSQENQFNLENYGNLIAEQRINSQKTPGRWAQFFSMTNPLYKDYLSSQGYSNVPGIGTADAAKIAGAFMGFGGGLTMPGQSATNQPLNSNGFGLDSYDAGSEALLRRR